MHMWSRKIFLLTAIAAMAAFWMAAAPAGAQDGLGLSYPQKARMLEDALRQDPNNVNTLIQLGNTYYDWGYKEINQKGDHAQPGYYWLKAIEYYRLALDKKPDDPNVRTDMSNLLWYTGNIDEAIKGYRAAIKSDPKHIQSRLNLINILADEKADYAGAIKEYDELVKAVPEAANDMSLSQTIARYRALRDGKGTTQAPHPMPEQPEEAPDYKFKY